MRVDALATRAAPIREIATSIKWGGAAGGGSYGHRAFQRNAALGKRAGTVYDLTAAGGALKSTKGSALQGHIPTMWFVGVAPPVGAVDLGDLERMEHPDFS